MKTERLIEYLTTILLDRRVNVWHIAFYNALLQLWIQNKQENLFHISRRKIMKLSRIRSTATYHKIIKDLQEFGYIEYIPSYDPFKGSQVWLH